jgi:hypothetical protein
MTPQERYEFWMNLDYSANQPPEEERKTIQTKHVETSAQIPKEDLDKIKTRLMQQINSMSDAEIRIATQSEASLKCFISDLFRLIAQLFGYFVGVVVGIVEETIKDFDQKWHDASS